MIRILLLLLLAHLISADLCEAKTNTPLEQPKVVKSQPADGAKNVSLNLGKVEIQFNRNMKMNTWTLQKAGKLPFPPLAKTTDFWIDAKTFVMLVKPLKEGVTYGIQLNGVKRKGFVTADTQETLPITTIQFTAGFAAKEELEQSIPDFETDTPQTGKLEKGYQFLVTNSAGVKGEIKPQGSEGIPMRFFRQAEFVDTVIELKGQKICEVQRQVNKAQINMMDMESGQMQKQELIPSGGTFVVRHANGDVTVKDLKTNEMVWDEDMKEQLSVATMPDLWPSLSLTKGQTWSYQGKDLVRRVGVFEPMGGTINLKVEKVAPEPSTGLMTAYIRGHMKTKIEMDPIPLEFNAKVEIDLPLDLGVPFMVKFEGPLSAKGSTTNEYGQPITFFIQAEGTVLQVCKPMALGQEKSVTPIKPDKKRTVSDSKAIIFKRVHEPKEKAFSLLIPNNWIIEGGMVRLDPTARGGASNSIDAKLDFCVKKDRTGTAMIRWLPELLYKDMRGSPARALGQFPDGSNYMGMTVWPLLSACDFLSQGVFQQAHPNANNVRVLEKRNLPEVAKKYSQALAATMPGANFTYTAGAILVAYEENGVSYKEMLYTAVENWGALGVGAWKNRSTFYLRTPFDEYETYSKMFAVIQNSVILNMQWIVGEIKGQIERGKIATMTYEEIQRIGREIVNHQQTTNAQIQHHAGLAIRGQEEYVNPHTGEKETGTNLWRNRWMDNDGNTIFSDNDDFDPNMDPRLDLSGFKRAAKGG